MSEEVPQDWQIPTRAPRIDDFPGTIGLIACGEITQHHLRAYRNLGFPVSILCDNTLAKAQKRRDDFYPDAQVTNDYRKVLSDPRVTIVDIATHSDIRPQLVEQAILAGKHVLSQKPFVEQLPEGRRLAELADQQGVCLAVNQNARWAPHFCFMRNALAEGNLGTLSAVRFSIQWDHTWTRDTRFAQIYHLMLYDFAIHWFDLIQCFFRGQAWQSVYASLRSTTTQNMRPPMMTHVVVDFPHGQASLCLDADTPWHPINQTYLAGSKASIHSTGPDYSQQTITVADSRGTWQIPFQGGWFPDGFGGAMSELARAIIQQDSPCHNAWDNLKSLELCYSAIASAESGQIIRPGQVTGLPDSGYST